jgi:glycine cleavage system H protein
MYPEELRYTKTHEWVSTGEDLVGVGITAFASEELSDIVYVELPSEGAKAVKGSSFAVLESVKAVSEVYAPVSGEIREVNHRLEDEPELLNNDPYGEGWIVLIHPMEGSETDELMDADGYAEFVEEEKGA